MAVKEKQDSWNGFGKQSTASIDEENASPKPSRSFLAHFRRPPVLNKRLILSRCLRSSSLLAFSDMFFPARPSVCSLSVLCCLLGPFVGARSTGSWFTTASLPSSSSATARNDRGQFLLSNRSGKQTLAFHECGQRRICLDQLNPVSEQDESWLYWAERPQ